MAYSYVGSLATLPASGGTLPGSTMKFWLTVRRNCLLAAFLPLVATSFCFLSSSRPKNNYYDRPSFLHSSPRRSCVGHERRTATSAPRLWMTASSKETFSNKTPQPPSTPPPLSEEFYQEALKEYGESAQTLRDLEGRCAELQAELEEKSRLLEEGQKEWDRERDELLDRMSEGDEDGAAERERLQREVDLLQEQLPAVQNLLRTEQRRSAELEEKLADLDYTLEYQQMEFEKVQKEERPSWRPSRSSWPTSSGNWSRRSRICRRTCKPRRRSCSPSWSACAR